MTGSTLDTTPQAPIWGVASNAEPNPLLHPSYTAAGQAFQRTRRPGYFQWLEHVRSAAGCTRPIRLAGTITTIEAGTGRLVEQRDTWQLPDAVIYKACGNRRHAVCPGCAHTYQRDAYHLVRAGLIGGKSIPESVSRHPAVFATLTAPSFGTVHTRIVRKHTCSERSRCTCRAEPCHPRRDAGLCRHGNPAVCWRRHGADDPALGRPLCLDCYQHDHQVVWNLHAGQLWHRTKHAIERHLARLAHARGISPVTVTTATRNLRRVPPVRVSHGKAAEFQARGAVHFHALLRLDGVDAQDPAAIAPPPAAITAADLEQAIRHAAAHTALHTPAHPDRPDGWTIGWGDQLDIRTITLSSSGDVTDTMVASYLAKYATKSTEATGHTSTRLTADTIADHADPDGDHTARLIDACWRLGRPRTILTRRQPGRDGETAASVPANPHARLRRWAHMLGFGGHFLTKARRYSITFTALRSTRVAHRRAEHHNRDQGHGAVPRAVDHLDQDTTLIIGTLTYAGAGWHTTGDALLANTAAALARERRTVGREELAHELRTENAGTLPVAA
jgi:hypothetical protein